MQLILSRHGNTFESYQTPTWVGAQQDLPLVAEGVQQAQSLVEALKKAMISLHGVYCAPLKRTRDYAQIIATSLGSIIQPVPDQRLIEIDYGSWAGLTSQQIKDNGNSQALIAWEQSSQWPQGAGWGGSEAQVIEQIKAFVHDLLKKHTEHDKILAVASNGCLRYFLHLIPGAFAKCVREQNFKVATGNISLLTYIEGKWTLNFWNKKPDEGLHEISSSL